MLEINKKYYLITHYNTFYKALFIGEESDRVADYTVYKFRTRMGDLFLYHKNDEYVNFITEDFEAVKMEIAQRVWKGKIIERTPVDTERVLHQYLKKVPEKFI